MRKVLITGAGSYIGQSIAKSLPADQYAVRELDVRAGLDASAFVNTDAVIHVAGIAHRAEEKDDEALYMRVNCDLAVQAARLAKEHGAKQFIFFSSMSVYGVTAGHITADTRPAPVTFYGSSKWAAEQQLAALSDDDFRIAVLRPPMIYGNGCRGNYPRLAGQARKLPVFPKAKNQRSMLYIETLCAFVEALLESGKGGLFFPQNREYVSTSELVTAVAKANGKRIALIPGFAWAIRLVMPHAGLVQKVFGTLTYDKAMSADFADAGQIDFAETIRRTEEKR